MGRSSRSRSVQTPSKKSSLIRQYAGPGELSRQQKLFALPVYLPHLKTEGVLEPSPICSPSVTDMEVTRNWKTPDERGEKKMSNQQFKTLLVCYLPLILDYMHREPDLPLKEHAA